MGSRSLTPPWAGRGAVGEGGVEQAPVSGNKRVSWKKGQARRFRNLGLQLQGLGLRVRSPMTPVSTPGGRPRGRDRAGFRGPLRALGKNQSWRPEGVGRVREGRL